MRTDGAWRGIREAGKDARGGAGGVDQRVPLGRASDADQHPADVRIDDDLTVPDGTPQTRLPGAQVVAAKIPGGGGEDRLVRLRQEQVQADVCQVESRRRNLR